MTDPEPFPCWIAADRYGALAYEWHEVRLVETTDDGQAAIYLDDGSEWLHLAAEPVLDAGQFLRKLAKVLALRAIAVQPTPSTAAT